MILDKDFITLRPPYTQFNQIPKEDWYRLHAREHGATRTKTLAELKQMPKVVRWSRSVVHIGHWLTPTEMPMRELDQETLRYATAHTGLSQEQLLAVIDGLRLGRVQAFAKVHWYLRHEWWKNQAAKPNESNIKTIWYFDHPEVTGHLLTTKGLVIAVIGKYNQGWKDLESGEAQPPTLTEWARQKLHWCEANVLPPAFGRRDTWRVHPLDLKFGEAT